MDVETSDAQRVIVIPESCCFLIVGIVIVKPSAGQECCFRVAIAAGFGIAAVQVDGRARSGLIGFDGAV